MTRSMRYAVFVAGVIALASTPLWAENYIVRLAIVIAMYSALVLSWNFIGGLVLGVVESFAGQFFGPQHALTVGFLLMLVLLVVKPTGLTGIKGYE